MTDGEVPSINKIEGRRRPKYKLKKANRKVIKTRKNINNFPYLKNIRH